jgi:hypothetical protein
VLGAIAATVAAAAGQSPVARPGQGNVYDGAVEAPACKPNFSANGRVRRRRIGWALVAVSAALAVAFAVMHAAWYTRLLVFLPSAGGAASLLQVARSTCVAHAALGTFEHDDFSTTKQSADDAARSRRVAATIYRDAILVGLVCAAAAAGSALL